MSQKSKTTTAAVPSTPKRTRGQANPRTLAEDVSSRSPSPTPPPRSTTGARASRSTAKRPAFTSTSRYTGTSKPSTSSARTPSRSRSPTPPPRSSKRVPVPRMPDPSTLDAIMSSPSPPPPTSSRQTRQKAPAGSSKKRTAVKRPLALSISPIRSSSPECSQGSRYARKSTKKLEDTGSSTLPISEGYPVFDDNAHDDAVRRRKERAREERELPLGKPQGSSTPRRGAPKTPLPRRQAHSVFEDDNELPKQKGTPAENLIKYMAYVLDETEEEADAEHVREDDKKREARQFTYIPPRHKVYENADGTPLRMADFDFDSLPTSSVRQVPQTGKGRAPKRPLPMAELSDDEDDEDSNEQQPSTSSRTTKTPRRSCQPTNFQGQDDSEIEEPSIDMSGRSDKSPRNPARIQKEREEKEKKREQARQEKEQEKERKRRKSAHDKAVAAAAKRACDADKQLKMENKKKEALAKKQKDEEERTQRKMLQDAEKDKKHEQMVAKAKAKKLVEFTRKRHQDAADRRKELRERGLRQNAIKQSTTPYAPRQSKRIRKDAVPPPKPQGRSKSVPCSSSRTRELEPKTRTSNVPRKSLYIENLNMALAEMKNRVLFTFLFETKAEKAAQDAKKGWTGVKDPYAQIRQDRLDALHKGYLGAVYNPNPDQGLELSDTDHLEVVEASWKPEVQDALLSLTDGELEEVESFDEINYFSEKSGFTSLRDLEIPTCSSTFSAPVRSRREILIEMILKINFLIEMWKVDVKQPFPRVIHYFRWYLRRNSKTLMTTEGEEAEEVFERIRDLLFWLPVHLGDVVTDVHLPQEHLIGLARQIFRVILNDWPLVFSPCPRGELHALYRLEYAALRLEARQGPMESWTPFWAPLDKPEMWNDVKQPEPRGPPPHVDFNDFKRPLQQSNRECDF